MSNQTWNNPQGDSDGPEKSGQSNNPPSYGAPDQGGQPGGYASPSYSAPDQGGQQPPYNVPSTPDQNIGQPAGYGAPGSFDQGAQNPYGTPAPYGGQPGYGGGPAYGGVQLASWGKRAYGALFDYVIPGIAGNLLSMPFQAQFNPSTGTMVGGNQLISTLISLAVFGFVLWNSGYQGGTTGYTIGRKFAKTKLVDEATGQPIGFGKGALRYIVHFVDSLICFVGWLFPLWDAKKQTLSDKIMKTIVIEDASAGQR